MVLAMALAGCDDAAESAEELAASVEEGIEKAQAAKECVM